MLERLYEAARGVLPEVMEEEIGSALERHVPFVEIARRIQAKGDRWQRLREVLAEVEEVKHGSGT